MSEIIFSKKRAAKAILNGDLVAFSTPTVWGLGADATNSKALETLFYTKKRPKDHPIILHLYSIEQIASLCCDKPHPLVYKLAKIFWPGPLTLVIPASKIVNILVTGGCGFVGLRMPDDPDTLEFLQYVGRPVGAPSANLHKHVSPTTSDHVLTDFPDNIIILSGNDSNRGIESTVVKIIGDKISILRPGIITAKELSKYASIVQTTSVVKESPGMAIEHYAPNAKTVYLMSSSHPTILIDVLEHSIIIDYGKRHSEFQYLCKAYQDISPNADIDEGAKNLFTALRWAETIHGHLLFLTDIPEHKGLHDRLQRAASGKCI